MKRRLMGLVAAAVALAVVPSVAAEPRACRRRRLSTRTNLVSSVPGLAQTTDPNLVNAWGIVAGDEPFLGL